MQDLLLRDISGGDIDALVGMEAAGFDHPWSREQVQGQLDQSPFCGVIAIGSGGAAGYIVGTVVLDEAEILRVVVVPALRGQGLGRRLVMAFLASAQGRGAASCFLEVASKNSPARQLYLSTGFKSAGMRTKYYSDGDDAVLMRLEFPKN